MVTLMSWHVLCIANAAFAGQRASADMVKTRRLPGSCRACLDSRATNCLDVGFGPSHLERLYIEAQRCAVVGTRLRKAEL